MANKELLRKVLQHIQNNPEQYDAVRWHADFAGWTLRLAVPSVEVKKDSCDIETMFDADGERIWISDIGPWAQRLLGLTMLDAARLFSAGNTLDDVERLVAEFSAGVRA
ncbi:hypothetical protein [Streptomyces rochei]|uniref:hypothetical protein n=1 Tax=Streptomyces rochei TaxID=1928 RepID=UPI0036F9B726